MNAKEFSDWLETARVSLGQVNRICIGPDAARLLSRWQFTLSSVDSGDADRCLIEIEQGRLEPPKFADEWTLFATFVRKWCRANRRVEFTEPVLGFGEETRYHCLNCRDSGQVPVINGEWLHSMRSEIESGSTPKQLSLNRRLRKGPCEFVVVCTCLHRQAGIWREEIENFKRGQRKKESGIPSRMDIYDEHRHAINWDDFNSSSLAWLASHAAAQPAGYYEEFT
jgi:hypothetical protein